MAEKMATSERPNRGWRARGVRANRGMRRRTEAATVKASAPRPEAAGRVVRPRHRTAGGVVPATARAAEPRFGSRGICPRFPVCCRAFSKSFRRSSIDFRSVGRFIARPYSERASRIAARSAFSSPMSTLCRRLNSSTDTRRFAGCTTTGVAPSRIEGVVFPPETPVFPSPGTGTEPAVLAGSASMVWRVLSTASLCPR